MTASSRLRTSELTSDRLSSLRANPDRLWSMIHDTAQWGTGKRYGDAPEQTGMSRLTLSDADKDVRAWFVKTAEELSCKTYTDSVGNIFAIRPGLNNDRPATFAGSHLDTQPTGGRFDGILGVCAGLEMLKVLEENWIETEGPVGVINWTNEEGARFPMSMMGSGVWAGALPEERVHNTKEVGNPEGGPRTVGEELRRISALGDIPAHFQKGINLGGHFELHIEQGPYLVSAGEHAAAVEGVQSYKWLMVTITGRDCHSGTTSFKHRVDALLCAATLIKESQRIAEKLGGLASTGIIEARPGSVNTVPGLVTMTLDIRHPQDSQVAAIASEIQDYINVIQEKSRSEHNTGVKITVQEDFSSPAVKFHPAAVGCVHSAAESVLGVPKSQIRKMTSGAGHDSVSASRHCPAAMIFVPCKNGVSHHPEEWCEKQDCAIGASILTEAVVRFDQERHQKGEFK